VSCDEKPLKFGSFQGRAMSFDGAVTSFLPFSLFHLPGGEKPELSEIDRHLSIDQGSILNVGKFMILCSDIDAELFMIITELRLLYLNFPLNESAAYPTKNHQ
jgi:hypothetical protein